MRKFIELAFGAKMMSKYYPNLILLKDRKTYRDLEEEEPDSVIIENARLLC